MKKVLTLLICVLAALPIRSFSAEDGTGGTCYVRSFSLPPRGGRVHASAPHGHWQTTTVISSMRLDGYGSTACMTLNGATDTEVFRAYVRCVLSPILRPGDIVIMDNLSAHKSELTFQLIEQADARVLLNVEQG